MSTLCSHADELIASALVYAGDTHTVADVRAMIASGEAQLWDGPHSIVVTQLDRHPRQVILYFFLAAGTSAELEAMEPGIIAWGRTQGCTQARFLGRKGWTRSFLARRGWMDTELVIMEKSINGEG